MKPANTFIIRCSRTLLVVYRIFRYLVSIFVTLWVIFLNGPFITTSAANQILLADLLHDSTSRVTALYFRNVDLFSELSRNMTASSPISSDLFENETTTEEDGTNNIIEGGPEEEETIIDSNETSSSESPSDLLDEDNVETEKGQAQDENIQNGADVNTQEDETAISNVPRQGEDDDENSDNTINNDLTNST